MNKFTDLKTFRDACKVEGLDADQLIEGLSHVPENFRKPVVAVTKLMVINKAANRLANNGQEWKPDWNNGQWDKYYPWFKLGGSSGFRFIGYDDWRSLSGVGSRLCFISAEVAEYIGNQFKDVYKDFMVIE